MDDLFKDVAFVSQWPAIRDEKDHHVKVLRYLINAGELARATNLAWAIAPDCRADVDSLCEEFDELRVALQPALESLSANCRISEQANEIPECHAVQQASDWNKGVHRIRELVERLSPDAPDQSLVNEIQRTVDVLAEHSRLRAIAEEGDAAAKEILSSCTQLLAEADVILSEDAQAEYIRNACRNESLRNECAMLVRRLTDARNQCAAAKSALDPGDQATYTAWSDAAKLEKDITAKLRLQFCTEPRPGSVDRTNTRPELEAKRSGTGEQGPQAGTSAELTEVPPSCDYVHNEVGPPGTEESAPTPVAAGASAGVEPPALVQIQGPEVDSGPQSPAFWLDQHLRHGRLAEAYWLTWSQEQLGEPTLIPSALLGAAAAARVQVPGETAGADARRFLEMAMRLTLGPNDALLASAAVLPLALFSPQPPEGVFTLASQLRTGMPGLDGLIVDVTSNCLYQGNCLTWAAISGTDPAEESEKRLRQAQAAATEFLEHQPHLSISFRPAAEAFRDAFREGQPLRRVLKAVREDNRREVAWVSEYMEDFVPEAVLAGMLTGQTYRGRQVHQIQGAARQKLLHHLEQFRSIVEMWLAACEGLAYHTERTASAATASLKRRILTKLPAIMDEVAEGKHDDGLRGAVLQVVIDTLRSIKATLDGSCAADSPSLTRTLLALPGVRLPPDLSTPEDALQIESIRLALAAPALAADLPSLVEETLSRGEFARAQALALDFGDDALRTRVEERIEDSLAETRDHLEEAESAVEDAYLLGLLHDEPTLREGAESQPSRSALTARLQQARQIAVPGRPPSAVELARAIGVASDVLMEIQELKKLREDEHTSALMALITEMRRGSPTEKEDADYLQSQASRFQAEGDVIALGELVSQASSAHSTRRRIDRVVAAPRETLNDFLDKDESLGRDWNKAEALAAVIRRQGRVGPVNFRDKDLEYCGRAAQAFKCWGELAGGDEPAKRGAVLKSVAGVLEFLTFPLLRSQTLEFVSAEPQLLHVRAQLAEAVTTCPIPAFGSAAFPKLDVVVCTSLVQPRALAEFLKRKGLVRTPVLVLHRPPLSKAYRLEFRNLASRMHLTALLVDFTLFLYCAGSRDPLPTLFELGLPFIWSQPYQMKGGIVPREMFVGRFEAVRSVWEPEGTSVVYGGRQLGKSALLRHVQAEFHKPSAATYVVYRDIDDLGVSQSFKEMKTDLWRRIAEELEHAGFLNSPAQRSRKKGRLPDALESEIRDRFRCDPTCRLTVLLDEADDLLDVDAAEDFKLTKQIRSLMDDTQRRFKVVFAGLQSVQRFYSYKNHPFAQLGRGYPITPLRPDAARDLIIGPLAALGFEFTEPALVYRILSQSNYHPGLVQIFCFRLLERLYQELAAERGVIRQIGRQDVIAIERDREFQAEIRDRFAWTLDLDDRYKVLVYALVISDDPTGALTETQFLDLGRIWWAQVFDDIDQQTARSLLDELVGLGVLTSEVDDGIKRYRLRSPNLLRLLGPKEEIEAELNQLISRCAARKPNPRHFRKLLDSHEVSFSPLTMEQGSQLVRSDQLFRVVLVRGSIPLGLQLVPRYLETVMAELREYEELWEQIRIPAEATARGSAHIAGLIADKLKQQNRPNRYAIIDACGLNEDESVTALIIEMLRTLPRLCRQKTQGLAIILLDSAATWRCLNDPALESLSSDERVSQIRLLRWSDGSLAKALEDLEMKSRAKDNGETLFVETDGIHILCELVLRSAKSGSLENWANGSVGKVVRESLKNPHLVINTGLAGLTAAVARIQDLATDGTADWDSIIDLLQEDELIAPQVLSDGGEKLREWLQATGLIGPTGADGSFWISRHLRTTN